MVGHLSRLTTGKCYKTRSWVYIFWLVHSHSLCVCVHTCSGAGPTSVTDFPPPAFLFSISLDSRVHGYDAFSCSSQPSYPPPSQYEVLFLLSLLYVWDPLSFVKVAFMCMGRSLLAAAYQWLQYWKKWYSFSQRQLTVRSPGSSPFQDEMLVLDLMRDLCNAWNGCSGGDMPRGRLSASCLFTLQRLHSFVPCFHSVPFQVLNTRPM